MNMKHGYRHDAASISLLGGSITAFVIMDLFIMLVLL